MIKKLITTIVSFLVIICSCTAVFADSNAVVGSEVIVTKQGESIIVPVTITDNSGLMGFRITVKYPDNQLNLTDITSGAVTKDGLFNTSISDFNSVKGNFDVLWSHSEEIKSDGTLFVLKFKVLDTASDGEYNISLSYSQEDTFDEKFNDVKLNCSPVKIYVGDVSTTKPVTESTTKNDDKKENSKLDVMVSDDYLISIFESVCSSFDMVNLTGEDKGKIVELTNNLLKSYDADSVQYSSYDELYSAYQQALKNKAVKEIIESTDDKVIQTVVKDVLSEHNADTFKELPDDKKQEAVEKFKQKLAENNSEVKTLNKIVDYDLATDTLDELVTDSESRQKENVTADNDSNNKNNNSPSNKTVIISVVVIAVLIIILAIWMIIKRKIKKDERK